jgi:hypothetical protein
MKAAVRELLERALELARAGVRVYEAALGCAVRDQLEEQWQGDLSQIRRHERALRTAALRLGVDPEAETSLRLLVRHQGGALISALQEGSEKAPHDEAERLAASRGARGRPPRTGPPRPEAPGGGGPMRQEAP